MARPRGGNLAFMTNWCVSYKENIQVHYKDIWRYPNTIRVHMQCFGKCLNFDTCLEKCLILKVFLKILKSTWISWFHPWNLSVCYISCNIRSFLCASHFIWMPSQQVLFIIFFQIWDEIYVFSFLNIQSQM